MRLPRMLSRRPHLVCALPVLVVLVPTVTVATLAVEGADGAAAATSRRPVAARVDLRPFEARPAAVLPAARHRRAVASRSHRRAPLHRWVRPSSGALSSPFGPRWGRVHEGIDLAGAYGSPIVAATDGVIEFAGEESGYGRLLVIRDWDGTETAYAHMSAFVRTSGRVRAGDLIARIGAGGDATGPHLHFEVRVDGTCVDPIPFLAKRGVRI